MTLGPLRVAAVQARAVAGDVGRNVAAAAGWAARAAGSGAAVVVLPELFLCGYDPATLRAEPDRCDVTPGDARLDPLRAAAASASAVVLAGASVRRADGRRTVSVLAFGPDGTCVEAYAKQHLWDEEREIFSPGDTGASVCVRGWELGLGVCYDGCFPEHARAAADAGALAYLCPSAYVVGSEHRRDLYYAARALDNGIYVAMAGLVGPCGDLEFGGGTAVYDPQGRTIARVGEGDGEGEGLAVADLDPEEVAEARRINPFDRDRVSDLGGRVRTSLPRIAGRVRRHAGAEPEPSRNSRQEVTRDDCLAMDEADPLAPYRDEFEIPDPALIYFDGNSLGRLPKATVERVRRVLTTQWGERLIRSWREEWMELPTRVGDLIGTGLLGGQPGETIVGDTTTVCLYKAVCAALEARPDRRAVVVERANFPTDRYVVESLAGQRRLEVRWVEEAGVEAVTQERLRPLLDEDVAAVVLAHVDYRSAAVADMPGLTRLVAGCGAIAVWDLCHSVGAVPVNLPAAGVDVAVGCTYKYLNGGPGAPAFTYVSRGAQQTLRQPIWGWWSRSDMFDMAQGYLPYDDIRAWLTGTPGILSLVGVETGVEMLVRAGVDDVRRKSTALTGLAVNLHDAWLAPLEMRLASPRDPGRRGSHVTLSHPEALRLADDLAARGVLPDFRRPDGIRIGLAPLTTRFVDVYDGLAVLRELVAGVSR